MKVSIGSDHAGFEQKQQLVDYLREAGYEVIDRGPDSDGRVDYSDYAELVCADVMDGMAERGVLVCGTGIGMSVAANKVNGIRSAVINNTTYAQLFREHNNGNVISLSGRFVGIEMNKAILDVFLTTEFMGGRHADRVAKIHAIEGRQ